MDSHSQHSLILSDDQLQLIDKTLSNLRYDTGAQCILLSDITGQLIAQVGISGDLDIPNLVSLMAGSFAVIFEMSRYLNETKASNLNFHEGQTYAVYSANVGEKLFLVLIYERRVQTGRIGMDWLYIKRAIPELNRIINLTESKPTTQVIDADFGASLKEKMDNLFD